MLHYEIIDQDAFASIDDVNLDLVSGGWRGNYRKDTHLYFTGTIRISFKDDRPDFVSTGEHGSKDFADDFGFVLRLEDEVN